LPHETLSQSLTLFLPGLLELPAREPAELLVADLRLPALQRLLARAEAIAVPTGGFEAALMSLFGCQVTEQEDVPVAAVTRLVEDRGGEPRVMSLGATDGVEPSPGRHAGAEGDWWLRADPVHLRPDLAKLILFDAGTFTLSDAEARALAAEVAPLFGEAGATLEVRAATRWYLRLPGPLELQVSPLSRVIGQDLREHRPQGADARRWQVLLTEVQMTLFASTVNQDREARGEPAVNSLWLWGGGPAPRLAPGGWAAVWSDDPLPAGLARLSGGRHRPGPASFQAWTRESPGPGEHLVVDDRLLRAVRYGDVEAWRSGLEALEEQWLAPLLAALEARRLAAATVLDGAGSGLRLGRGELRRWWRRPRPLASHYARTPRG
jgi:hypothetical protein